MQITQNNIAEQVAAFEAGTLDSDQRVLVIQQLVNSGDAWLLSPEIRDTAHAYLKRGLVQTGVPRLRF